MNLFGFVKKTTEPESTIFLLTITRGSRTKKIKINPVVTFDELDQKIRSSFKYDTWDHCSALFDKRGWSGKCFAESYPDSNGLNQKLSIGQILKNVKDNKFIYIYDFGDDKQHLVSIVKVY